MSHSARRADAFFIAALCVLLAGCSMGSRRVQPGDYPVDPRLDCLLDDRHVMLFLIDGCRADLLREMARTGELPAIQRYFIARGSSAECAVSTVPSVTNACIAAVTCGVYPGHLGVSGNRWFDRDRPERIAVFGLRRWDEAEIEREAHAGGEQAFQHEAADLRLVGELASLAAAALDDGAAACRVRIELVGDGFQCSGHERLP